jgi:flagellar basal-body rod protein FlgB
MNTFLGDKTSVVLQQTLTGLSRRQQVIGNNLANLNTPNFKASEVVFESELKRALDAQDQPDMLVKTHATHLAEDTQSVLSVEPIERAQKQLTMRLDGNSVDVEREMASLAETVLRFQSSAQVLSRKLAMWRSVITGR